MSGNLKAMSSKAKVMLFSSALSVLALTAVMSSTYYIDSKLNERKATAITNVKEVYWDSVYAVIQENRDKAQTQADTIRDNIRTDIANTYTDKSKLQDDLNFSKNTDSKLLEIFDKNISGKYINVKNDNNDVFVMSPTYGKLSDKSLNCAKDKKIVPLDQGISMHYNKDLATKALDAIIKQDKGFIFWEYLEPPKDTKHSKIRTMKDANMINTFMKEGVSGLAYYEVLVPSYLEESTDILGVPDVDSIGKKTVNNKIVVVQGFNIADELTAEHSGLVKDFDGQLKEAETFYSNMTSVVDIIGLLLSLLFFAVLISIVTATNKILKE